MINTCQTWSEKARMQLNADTTKIMCFHKNRLVWKPHKPALRENEHEILMAALFGQRHSTSSPCTQTTPTPQICISQYPAYSSTLLQEVKQFDYFGLRLDPMVNMKAAVSSIQEKANKAYSLVLAVSYSLRYDKHHSNPTICSSPVELLNLWKSCVLPHFLLYLHYISDETSEENKFSGPLDLIN